MQHDDHFNPQTVIYIAPPSTPLKHNTNSILAPSQQLPCTCGHHTSHRHQSPLTSTISYSPSLHQSPTHSADPSPRAASRSRAAPPTPVRPQPGTHWAPGDSCDRRRSGTPWTADCPPSASAAPAAGTATGRRWWPASRRRRWWSSYSGRGRGTRWRGLVGSPPDKSQGRRATVRRPPRRRQCAGGGGGAQSDTRSRHGEGWGQDMVRRKVY